MNKDHHHRHRQVNLGSINYNKKLKLNLIIIKKFFKILVEIKKEGKNRGNMIVKQIKGTMENKKERNHQSQKILRVYNNY